MQQDRMTKPEMIIFDYGQTLAYEPGFDLMRGYNELFKHITVNPDNVTAEELKLFSDRIFQLQRDVLRTGYEPHSHQGYHAAFEYYGIELDVDIAEAERIIWDNTSFGAVMPHADELLRYLDDNNIRYGIISNIGWSGKALTDRINRLFPGNRFEFIIASSEYGIRKPDRRIFDIALRKAAVSANRCWYCGDSIEIDVKGALSAEMTAVLYESTEVESPHGKRNDGLYGSCEYLHIHDWRELIGQLNTIQHGVI